ncbi:hypothetical protein P692DRAFT_20837724 [Suillus brevipes Sb2]|nr:hypothetical protein P692DRAFT_20837724 [Suillus brevipes Sb2]
MPAARHNTAPVNCPICDKAISRNSDLPRHVRTHYKDNQAFMHTCPFPNCAYKAVQKTNLKTHIRTHTGELSHRCPQCPFATTDPASLTRHRRNLHGYQPRARRYLSGKAARMSAAAPYPSTQHEGDIPASLDFNPVFSDFAGLVPCDALSPAESSHSGIPEFQDDPHGSLSSPPTLSNPQPSLLISPLSAYRRSTRGCYPMTSLSRPSPPPTPSNPQLCLSSSPLSTYRRSTRGCYPMTILSRPSPPPTPSNPQLCLSISPLATYRRSTRSCYQMTILSRPFPPSMETFSGSLSPEMI